MTNLLAVDGVQAELDEHGPEHGFIASDVVGFLDYGQLVEIEVEVVCVCGLGGCGPG
jgi:hypothetical protein